MITVEIDMNMKPIEASVDYAAALNEIEKLMTAQPNTPQGEKFDELVTLVEVYEAKHYIKDFAVK
jgi:HTH-type transcriptional regulator/antitoxin HigA